MSFVAIAVSVTAIGATVGAVGAYSAAKSSSDAAKYNSKVQANNAAAAGQQSRFNAQQISDQTRRQVAMQRAAMASSGFDVNSGSFSDIQQDTKRQGELSRLSSIYMGRLGINQDMSASALSKAQAGNDMTAGYFGVASSLIGGASKATDIAANPNFGN
jgi:hypothetical protein